MRMQTARWLSRLAAVLRSLAQRRSTRAWLEQGALAVVGVAVVTLAIGVTRALTHVSNLSLLYLLVVLWLAARYGRWPAILASILSFLSYDFFFIPPVHEFTVDDPTEWVALFALLATALTLGHLTAVVHARAADAEESRRQTDTLYRLAQMIAVSGNERDLYTALTSQAVTAFAPSGARSCALLLPDENGALEIVAISGERDGRDGDDVAGVSSGGTRRAILRRPLKTPHGEVGKLMIAGTPAIHGLSMDDAVGLERVEADPRQAPLFSAYCDQIALAIERAGLAREAAHAAALRESDRLKDALLGSVTHELRTPLASIKAAASSLLNDDMRWTPPERRELLESIETSADRLNRLVGNLLDLSRLEAGVAQPVLDWMLMSDVVAAVLDRLELAGQTRGYHIQVEEPENLPLVLMDHEQIEQALTNLIENALKYSPQGSLVRVRVATDAQNLVVSVSDQGIGIPPRELEAVFDKFYRVKQARLPWSPGRPPTGTGLGLAISASIIRAHGGRIWAESEPGKGAILTFTLPLAQEQPPGALPDLPHASAPTPDEPTESEMTEAPRLAPSEREAAR
jgi:two-component system, OmpR family, sensor histidine kinase KdpD